MAGMEKEAPPGYTGRQGTGNYNTDLSYCVGRLAGDLQELLLRSALRLTSLLQVLLELISLLCPAKTNSKQQISDCSQEEREDGGAGSQCGIGKKRWRRAEFTRAEGLTPSRLSHREE